MPAHVFITNRENYNTCLQRGVVGIPAAKEDSRNKDSTNDALISRICIVKEDDYILFYVTGENSLFGVWQVEGTPFFDESTVWSDRLYPYRVRFKSTPYSYPAPLKLHDIYDLQNEGKIWNFALKRASGSNAMFSLSNSELALLINEYSKANPYTSKKRIIPEPYPVRSERLLPHIHLNSAGEIKYEAGVMAFLLNDLTLGKHKELFGNYTDYLCYAPTTIGNEMDILLTFGNPLHSELVSSYDIIELKRDVFDKTALAQLIGYETWFLQKKAYGDQRMVRSTAIARSFSDEVIRYVQMRQEVENKAIKLVCYSLEDGHQLVLNQLG